MGASYIANIMGISGAILLCAYDAYNFWHIKIAIDSQSSREIPYVVSLLGIGYQTGWILYFDTIVPDMTLLLLNLFRLLIGLLIFISFLFIHFDTRTGALFASLFAPSTIGWYFLAREFREMDYFEWPVAGFHALVYCGFLVDSGFLVDTVFSYSNKIGLLRLLQQIQTYAYILNLFLYGRLFCSKFILYWSQVLVLLSTTCLWSISEWISSYHCNTMALCSFRERTFAYWIFLSD